MSALSGLGYLTSGLTQGATQGMQYNAAQQQLQRDNAARTRQLDIQQQKNISERDNTQLAMINQQIAGDEAEMSKPEFANRPKAYQDRIRARRDQGAAKRDVIYSRNGLGAPYPSDTPNMDVSGGVQPAQPTAAPPPEAPAPPQLKSPDMSGSNMVFHPSLYQPEGGGAPGQYGNPANPNTPPTPHDTAMMMQETLGPVMSPGAPVFHSQPGVQSAAPAAPAQPAQRAPVTPDTAIPHATPQNAIDQLLGQITRSAHDSYVNSGGDPVAMLDMLKQAIPALGGLATTGYTNAQTQTENGMRQPRINLTNNQAFDALQTARHTGAETAEIPANSEALRASQRAGAYASVKTANTGAAAEKHNYELEGKRVGIAGKAETLAETAEDHRWRQQVDEATQRYQQLLTSSATAGGKQDAQNKLIALNAAKGMYFNKDQITGALTPSPKATRDAADQILRAVGISFGGNPAASIPPGVDPQMWQISAGGPASINAFMKDPKRSAAQKQALKFAIGVRQKQSRMPAPSAADIFGAGSSPQPENNSQQ